MTMKCISIFKCNPQIEVIDKSHCSLEDVPNFQNYSRSLEELFLDANKLTVLNDNVFRLTKLRRFSFSDNEILDIPPDIARLVNLVELDCHRNNIQNIPDQIKFLRGLQVCDFSANNIEYLPPGLVQLKNLTCLTLNYCLIKSLPDDFGLLKNLESLELRENDLQSLPASITSLESLKKLDIGCNGICELPEDIGRLSKLEYLLVDGNRLETVPVKIGRLENLQCLDLSRQDLGLKYLPDEISGLISLTDLHLSDNHLKSLPDGILNLRSLTIFKADTNFLSDLNPNIGGCISLQELVLTANQISRLPSSIGALSDLRSLNVDSNLLEELPPQIGDLRRLGILSLRDNLLTYLPNEIGQLELVKVMDISGNRLEYLPFSMTALNLKALWLSKNQAQPLPKLQIDELQESGTKVLTCYLLPQQSEENDSGLERTNTLQGDYEPQFDQQRQAAVSFDTAAIDDAELSNDGQFTRHDTPHPRELKARHQKLFDTTTGKPELTGHVNASFSMADNKYDYDMQDPINNNNNVQQQTEYRQQLDYDSNGLPEVPMLSSNIQKTIKPQQQQHPSMTYRDNNNYKDQQLTDHQQIVSRYSHDYTPRPTSYENNGLGFQSSNVESHQPPLSQRDCQILDILVRRSKNHKPGLGLSIAGGKDTPPYMDNDEGIFVSKVTRGGPAEAAKVKVGDKILAVNNNIFYEGITHQKAVDIFKKVKPDCMEFTMRVMRYPDSVFLEQNRVNDDDQTSIRPDSVVTATSKLNDRISTTTSSSTFTRTYTIPTATESTNGTSSNLNGKQMVKNLNQYLSKEPQLTAKGKSNASTLPPGLSLLDQGPSSKTIYTTLVKDYSNDLGLVLENRPEDNEARSNWSNIVISKIKPNSIAARDGKLQVDDKLLSVNGTDVNGIDLERIMLMLEGTERFIRIVVARGEYDDPISQALRNMPTRPQLGSWFSSTSNMSHRPSLAESYQRPRFGSATSLQKQNSQLVGTKPPKPPKPTHLQAENLIESPDSPQQYDDNPTARPRSGLRPASGPNQGSNSPEMSDAERRAAWRRDRLRSIEDDVEMAKLIAEAQRRRREEK